MSLLHAVRRTLAPFLAVYLSAVVAALPLAQAAGRHADAGPEPSAARLSAGLRGNEARPTPGLSVDRLVQQVLRHNPGIEAMRAAADAAGARIESAGALDDPMLSYAVAPNTAGGPRQGLNQNVQVSQKFPWPGTLALRRRMASATAESADGQVADLRLRLAALARTDYAQWYYVHRALSVNAENRALVARLRNVAETAYASGQSPQQDVLQAEVELVSLDNQASVLRRLQRTVQAKINALQNLEPEAEVEAPGDLPREIPLPTLAALENAALAHYPMLQSLDARISASRDRVDLAHRNNYPNISLLAGYNSLMDLPAKRLTVGIAINIPFGGNHRGELDEANARLHESEAGRADVRNRLLSELAQVRATAEQAAGTVQLYSTRLLPLIRLNMQAAEAEYSSGSGAGDFLKLITAQRQYLKAELELARARADFYIQLASLDYLTGGAMWPSSLSTNARGTTP